MGKKLKVAIWGTCLALVIGCDGFLFVAVEELNESVEWSDDNLFQVALAMHSYHDVHGTLPPAALRAKDGTPLLSWRVLILPYIDQSPLYKEFRLDEAWDSPHNIKLLPRLPSSFTLPPRKASKIPPYHTVCQVFVGPGTAFEGPDGLRLKDDFPDGLQNTILVIEAGEPVPWTKPEDIPYDPHKPLPGLKPIYRQGFHVGAADGGWRRMRRDISEATLRALITRNGGETLGEDWHYPRYGPP